MFQKGNKLAAGKGRKRNTTAIKSAREYIRNHTDWTKIHKVLVRLALGGEQVTNGAGTSYVTQPNLDAVRILLDRAWGKVRDLEPEPDTTIQDAPKKFVDEFKDGLLPGYSVNDEGKLEKPVTDSTEDSTTNTNNQPG